MLLETRFQPFYYIFKQIYDLRYNLDIYVLCKYVGTSLELLSEMSTLRNAAPIVQIKDDEKS